jgi:hypothetical protein
MSIKTAAIKLPFNLFSLKNGCSAIDINKDNLTINIKTMYDSFWNDKTLNFEQKFRVLELKQRSEDQINEGRHFFGTIVTAFFVLLFITAQTK